MTVTDAVDANPWAAVIDALDKHDEHMIEGGKESIDSFLTFVSIHRQYSRCLADKLFEPGWSFLCGPDCL